MAQTLNALIYPHTPEVISETRMLDVATIPAHKASWWRPVIDEPPAFNAALETRSSERVIEAERVVIEYTVARRPLDQQKAAVKAEAQRRIIALTGTNDLTACMIKQSNANMQANELNDKRLNGDALTVGEETEAQALRDLAAAIKAVRAKSNEIEQLDPIPLDYTADSYWTD
jgi:hypothetical protein